MANLPNIPSLPSSVDASVRRAFDTIKAFLTGQSTDIATLATAISSQGVAANNGVIVAPEIMSSIPPQPLNVTATGGFAKIMIEWDTPNYRFFAYAEVWRSTSNDLGTAVLIGTANGEMYTDQPPNSSLAVAYYYWVRFVSTADIKGSFSDVATAHTADDPAYMLEVLANEITASQLHNELSARIDLVDDPTTGLVTQVAQQAAELSSISDQIASFVVPAFDSNVAYLVNDYVRYNGNVYQCILNTSVPSPNPTNTTYWSYYGVYAGDAAQQAAASAAAAATSAADAVIAKNSASGYATNAANSATNSATSATNAAGSASTATTQASNAASSAGTAGTAATNANSAKVAAEAASVNATDKANAASTSANSATASATSAGNSATSASNSATAASTSAGQASTSASQASTSATNAAGSANSASTSATNAANSATSAGNSATAAASSASTASTKATEASNSATSASGYQVSAKSMFQQAAANATNILMVDPINEWSAWYSPQFPAPLTQTADIRPVANTSGNGGACLAVKNNADIYSTRLYPVSNGRTYKLTMLVKRSIYAANSVLYAGYAALDADLNNIQWPSSTYQYVLASNVDLQVASGWTTSTITLTGEQIIGTGHGIMFIRMMALVNYPSSNGSEYHIARLSFEDITESTSAGNSASAAATSASNASTSASQAASSATSASGSATNASTSAGSASTYATQASTSATNAANSATAASGSASSAAGSATTASTKAGEAATSASQASTSATNASGSASSASTSASAAATSATNSGNSASAASVSANNASTSATNAASSATSASSSANSASTSAGSASTYATNAASSASTAQSASSTAGTHASNAAGYASTAQSASSTASAAAATITAQYTIKVDANGKVAGMGLWSDGITSDFEIRADKFAFCNTSGLGKKFPFIIDGGVVYLAAASIQDGTIANAKIANLAVDSAKIADGAIATAKIADAAIATAKIGSAAVGSAQIADAAITSAKIGAAEVGTLKIAGSAVTIPVTYTNSTRVDSNGQDIEIASATITLDYAGTVAIVFSGTRIATSTAWDYTMKLKRDGVLKVSCTNNWAAYYPVITFSESLAAGTYTYNVYYNQVTGAGYVTDRTLLLLGAKR